MTRQLSNHWITVHQNGVPAGFTPLLVMDVWEHAFMRDDKATERGKYLEAFFRNIDWPTVERRLLTPPSAPPWPPDGGPATTGIRGRLRMTAGRGTDTRGEGPRDQAAT